MGGTTSPAGPASGAGRLARVAFLLTWDSFSWRPLRGANRYLLLLVLYGDLTPPGVMFKAAK